MKRRSFLARFIGATFVPIIPLSPAPLKARMIGMSAAIDACDALRWQKSSTLACRGRTDPFAYLIGGKSRPIEVMDFKALQGKQIRITLNRR